MDRRTFDKIRELVYEKSGIALSPGKEALVAARVGKRMRTLAITEYSEYLKHVVADNSGQEMINLLDAISTNVTSFFREPIHFDFLQDVVKAWIDQKQKRLRFWSAACSTGEEPYSLAMTLSEVCNGYSPDVKILATDISTQVLAKSQAGVYDNARMENVPKHYRSKYFSSVKTDNGQVFEVNRSLRNMVVFRRLNLSTPPFPMNGPLDVIFCRNVMIYFDNTIRKKLLDDMYRLLKPGGFLMVGHAESLTGLVSAFRTVRPSIYTK